ncbi:MAG: CDP-alcohol phosphatidyltransferase family protein [SAR324 cluster bacterium]|nr:CDP-alcohol phosphatidyltransferase family protein [SAR324 cluster bacterium]
MPKRQFISRNVAIILVYGRPPLVFAGMLCAIAVMLTQNPVIYSAGVMCLFISMSFDLVDGWFAARFHPHSKLSPLADRIMDKLVYSIIFPVVALGVMWQFHLAGDNSNKQQFLHVIFVLILCVSVLVRDHFAHFMRNFALRKGENEELREIGRLRTIVAAPVVALLYAHAFYVSEGPSSAIYFWSSWLGNIPLRVLFFIEIVFLIINFGSVAMYCRKYGSYCLDDLCLGDEILRRRILSFFPNALTVMNAMMGVLAIFFTDQGRIEEAYLILLGAAMFDKLDGAVARKLGLTEPPSNFTKSRYISFGGILDDISDAVSFCIAPASIFYIIFSNSTHPELLDLPYGWIAVLYALTGVGRLIYFTIDRAPIPGFFKGIPTPAAALWVTAPLIMLQEAMIESSDQVEFWGMVCFCLMIVASILMNVYPIRYLHLGRFMGRHPWFLRVTLLLLLLVFTPYFGHAALLYLTLYVFSPVLTWRISPEVAEKESRNKPITSH